MLLTAGILESVGGLLILGGAFLQAQRAFREVVHGPTRHGIVEKVPEGDVPQGSWLKRLWWKSRWFHSVWRDSSLLDGRLFHAWMLILAGAALVLVGTVITTAAAA